MRMNKHFKHNTFLDSKFRLSATFLPELEYHFRKPEPKPEPETGNRKCGATSGVTSGAEK